MHLWVKALRLHRGQGLLYGTNGATLLCVRITYSHYKFCIDGNRPFQESVLEGEVLGLSDAQPAAVLGSVFVAQFVLQNYRK